MNAKVNVKETVGGSESMKEGNPIVPNEGTLEFEGMKILTTSWKGLAREYYVYQNKLYVVFSEEWGDLVKQKVQEVDLNFLAYDVYLALNSKELKVKGVWEE